MSDLAKTQAQWSKALGSVLAACVLAPIIDLYSLFKRFIGERERLITVQTTYLTAYGYATSVTGAIPGTNMTEGGIAYMRVTDAGGGNWTVSGYMATGAASKVVEGTAAAGAVATLSAQNGSGLEILWQLPASPSALAADTLEVKLYQDYPLRAARVLTEAGGDDMHALRVLQAGYAFVAREVYRLIEALVGYARRALLSDTENPKALLNAFRNVGVTTFESERRYSPDNDGNYERARSGWFPGARLDMADDTEAGAQSVVERSVTVGTAEFNSSNTGKGTVSATTVLEMARACHIEAYCSSQEIGSETFDGTITFTDDGLEKVIPFSGWQVGKAYVLPGGFGPWTIVRTYAKTGDGSDLNLAAEDGATAPVFTNATAQNTGSGTLWWKIVASGSNWNVYFYAASTMLAEDLVAQALDVATGNNFTAEGVGTALSVSWKVGSGPTTATTGTVSMQPFKSARAADQGPDTFTIDVTVDADPGLINTVLARHFGDGAFLASTTAGSETIPDEWAQAGVWPHYDLEF